ncbi:ArnT family glycosyltransferase [Patescibacteria group bacterium]
MNLKKILSKYWLLLVLIIFLFLKVPCLFEPFTYGDEGIYLSLGQASQKGLTWYQDIHDNKPPMLYLVAALAGNFTTYRSIHFGWSLITILAFWQLAKLIFPKNKPAIGFSTLAFTLLTSLHSLEGNVGNAENFMLLLIIAAFHFVYEQLPKKHKKGENLNKSPAIYYTAGTFLGLATLFKIPAGFDFAAILCLLLVFPKKLNRQSWLNILTSGLYLTTGFLSPILLSFAFYGLKHALPEYIYAAFSQNIPYLSSWAQSKPQAGGLPIPMISRGLMVLLTILGVSIFRKKIPSAVKLILIWFAFSWFAVLLSSRPYPHYLLQLVPAFSLSIGLIFPLPKILNKNHLKNIPKKIFVPLFLALVFQLTFSVFHFWKYPNLDYYLNFYQLVLGQKNKEEYFKEFDSKAKYLYQAADYIRKRTRPSEKIFIWGTEPSIYPLSQRLPLGRYTTSYHIIDFNGYEETMILFQESPPPYLIVSQDEKRPFPKLFHFIQTYYSPPREIGHLRIYRLNSTNDKI